MTSVLDRPLDVGQRTAVQLDGVGAATEDLADPVQLDGGALPDVRGAVQNGGHAVSPVLPCVVVMSCPAGPARPRPPAACRRPAARR